jgi:mannose-6-phosphate isomerase-like protein (cupin superfamily)
VRDPVPLKALERGTAYSKEYSMDGHSCNAPDGSQFVVHHVDVEVYSSTNHTGRVSWRLITLETLGARNLKVLRGTLQPGKGTVPHPHPTLDQFCYIQRGTAQVTVAGMAVMLSAGDICFLEADGDHEILVTGNQPVELLVIYLPSYGDGEAGVES